MTDGLTGHHAELLQKVDLFAGLDRMALAQVAVFVEPVTVKEGEVVFHQGEPGDALYIVARGKFGVFVSLPDAPTEVRLTTLRPGDVFGEMALLTDEPRSATVRNEDGMGEVLRLERSRFYELIRREPALVQSIAATLTRRLQANARIILQSEHFIVSVVDQALARLDPERRRKILEASVLDEITAEALAALFGPDAHEVTRNLGECGVVLGQPAGPVLRVLRERLERELGTEYWQQYAQHAATRLADAGIWPAALSLYARYAPRPALVEALGRALRDARAPAPEEIAPWLERASDEEAAQDAEVVLAKTEVYQERGDIDRAMTLLRRALGTALSSQNTTDARRLNTAIARLALAAGQDSTPGLQYGLQPSRVRLARRVGTSVMLIAGAAVLAAIALLFPLAPAAKFVLLLGAAVFLMIIGALAALFIVLRPSTKTVLPRDRLALQLAVLGPPARREMAMAAVLGLTVAGWLLAPTLHVDAGTVALLGLLAAFITGNLDRQSLREVDWNYLVFYGVALSLGGLTTSLGLSKTVSETIGTALTRLGVTPVFFMLLVAVLSIMMQLVIGEQTVLLLSLTFIPVASVMGVDPWVVVIAILSTVLTWILPATTPEYLVAHSASEGRLYSHPQAQRVALAYVVVTLVGLALATPYWKLIGLL